jgi:hypothetical protein
MGYIPLHLLKNSLIVAQIAALIYVLLFVKLDYKVVITQKVTLINW